jgi:hypothetical protein
MAAAALEQLGRTEDQQRRRRVAELERTDTDEETAVAV